MIESDPQLGAFNITARLFKLIHEMPKDQQLILLKQLIGDNVTKHLFKLIVEMSEDQQIILLEQMGETPTIESPITTVSLEETGTSMRENPRKPCLINANYRIQDRKFKSYILDISIGGVFIETDQKLPVGNQMMLKFSLPNHTQPFTLKGKIAWSGPRGFGVKFDEMTPQQGDLLKTYVDQKD
jgi:uncharacterized protein (TIGR02266 family)